MQKLLRSLRLLSLLKKTPIFMDKFSSLSQNTDDNKMLRFLSTSPKTTTRIGRTSSSKSAFIGRAIISSSSSNASLRASSSSSSSRFCLGKCYTSFSTSKAATVAATTRRSLLSSASPFSATSSFASFPRSNAGETVHSSNESGRRRKRYSIQANAGTPREECMVTTPIYYVNDKPHIGHVYTLSLIHISEPTRPY